MHYASPPPVQLISAEAVSRAFFILLFSASLILIINQYSDVDQVLADVYFDAQRNAFPWRDSWFATGLMHGWVKYAIITFGLLILGVTLIDAVRPLKKITPLLRIQLRVVALTMISVPLVVALLKQGSNVQCPWSLERYGCSEPLLRLLDWVPPHWDAGRCFPAGQASTGSWLAALAVFWLPNEPRRAFHIFVGGMVVGLALGWVQQMRGAHFLTHTLATLWVSSALLLAVLVVVPRLQRVASGSLRQRVAS